MHHHSKAFRLLGKKHPPQPSQIVLMIVSKMSVPVYKGELSLSPAMLHRLSLINDKAWSLHNCKILKPWTQQKQHYLLFFSC
jgi:hypothetical protein